MQAEATQGHRHGRARSRWRGLAATVALAIAAGLPGGGALHAQAQAASSSARAYLPLPAGQPAMRELVEIGRRMFFDASLSASGRVSCASCHDPAHGHAPANAEPVQRGGTDLQATGFRATPSLRYLHALPPFSEHHFENDGDSSNDAGPTGGHGWDGRADSAHEQATLPLLSPHEMGNRSAEEFAQRLRAAGHAPALRRLAGDNAPDAKRMLMLAGMALEVFQQTPQVFYPYSSRYDEVLRGRATLTDREARGLALFNDAERGNCASCHPAVLSPEGAFPLFTDFGHVALGVPRNRAIPANHDPAFFDLGLCGPLRIDYAGRDDKRDYCGRFRTPSLRNVAVRQSFFHNGVFHRLDEVLRFYVERESDPGQFYGKDDGKDGHGKPVMFDDLPVQYRRNVETAAPFDPGAAGRPRLTRADIADVIAFLCTLTDADLKAQAVQCAAPR